jgi:F-type H+-transporting ATPase subunit delta
VTDKETLVRRYAEALFAVAEVEGEAGPIADQLFAFAKGIERDAKLRDALTDPALPAENKRALVRDLLGERANPHALNILGFLIDEGRTREIERIVQQVVAVAAEHRRHVVAEVRSAVPLDTDRRARLSEALSHATGKDVELKVVVDPQVVGGLVARVGDEVFDGTVRSHLAEARRSLAGTRDGRDT